jgi:hypothetical protein
VVHYIAGLLNVPVDEARWKEGRQALHAELQARGAKSSDGSTGGVGAPGGWQRILRGLVETPVFILVWFLWFLVWLVGLFAVYAVMAARCGWQKRPWRLVLSPARMLWLVPLTMVPTSMMGSTFGPDTSMGILPMPHVLLYYILFFFFGVFYFDCDDRGNHVGSGWCWSMPLTMLVVFPLALEFAEGTFGFRDALLPVAWHKPASVFLQSVYAWGMCFGSIGLFRARLTRENPVIRYLSDSSYWFYLAHLPLIIAAQAFVAEWKAPPYLKLAGLSAAATVVLLLSYHYLVRYTWVGRLLNGPRKRPGMV